MGSPGITKKKVHSSCDIEYFVESPICELCVIVTKVYPYPGYCATVQGKSQKFRVMVIWGS